MNLADYKRLVISLRDDYSEEIPEEIINSTHQHGGPKFKVRKGWFQVVSFALENGVRKGYLPSEYVHKIQEFQSRIIETGFHDRRTTKEDIMYANGILEEIIACIPSDG